MDDNLVDYVETHGRQPDLPLEERVWNATESLRRRGHAAAKRTRQEFSVERSAQGS